MPYGGIRNENLTDRIGKADRYRQGCSELACVVVELGETQDVTSNLIDIGVPVLDIYPKGTGTSHPS